LVLHRLKLFLVVIQRKVIFEVGSADDRHVAPLARLAVEPGRESDCAATPTLSARTRRTSSRPARCSRSRRLRLAASSGRSEAAPSFPGAPPLIRGGGLAFLVHPTGRRKPRASGRGCPFRPFRRSSEGQ